MAKEDDVLQLNTPQDAPEKEQSPAPETVVAETPVRQPEAAAAEAPEGGNPTEAPEPEKAGGVKRARGRLKDKLPDPEEALRHFESDTETVAPPKKRKYGWVGNVALLVVIGLSIWMMLEIVMTDSDEYLSFGETIMASDWRFFLISVAVLFVIITCICMEYVVVIKATTNKFALRTGIKVALLGKFYDNITPFATGGQPMQIYYLHKKGYSGGISSAVVLVKYFFWMICWLIVSMLFMACNVGVLDGVENTAWRTVILVCGWIGLGVNLLLPLIVLLFAVLPKLSRKVASIVVGIGNKIKIVKDKDKALNKAYKIVRDFRSSFAIMAHRPLLFVALIALCLIEVTLNYMLPYFIMRMYSGITSSDISVLFAVTSLNTYVILAVSIIPTPGNTGAMEGIGALAFSAFVSGSIQFWSMLTWRAGIYYIYIIIGLGITIFEFIRKAVRSRRNKVDKQ